MATTPASDPTQLSTRDLVALYGKRARSPVEAVKATLARIERMNPPVNAYCHLDAEGALAAARSAEGRWLAGTPLGLVDGVPLGVKDNIAVAGMPLRFGSKLTAMDDACGLRCLGGGPSQGTGRRADWQDGDARVWLESDRR